MIALTASGLPLSWDRNHRRLITGPGLEDVVPDVRRAKELQGVLYWGTGTGAGAEILREDDLQRILYYMYRGLHLRQDAELFRAKGVRYDLTILIPGALGQEYIKTAGHYHPFKPGTTRTYPEVYEVLYGKAHYLLQRPKNLLQPESGLEEINIMVAEAGDKILIPPGFGHVTINPGPDFLIMSNLVAAHFDSLYEPLQKMKGAGYFQLVSEAKSASKSRTVPELAQLVPEAKSASKLRTVPELARTVPELAELAFVPNPNYSHLPPLRICKPPEIPAFSLFKNIPLYKAFLKDPNRFAFLA